MLKIIDSGIISRQVGRGAYMPSVAPLPDGTLIACQFVGRTFVSSDGCIEVLRSADGGATWANEGGVLGEGEAESGWSYRGPRISVVPDGRLMMCATRFDTSRIAETFDAKSESLQRPEMLVFWSRDQGHTSGCWCRRAAVTRSLWVMGISSCLTLHRTKSGPLRPGRIPPPSAPN